MKRQYLGRAGEYWVASNLLRLEFNVSPLPVDSGVDLLASRQKTNSEELELFQVQVKTTSKHLTNLRFLSSKLHSFFDTGVNLVVVYWPEVGAPQALVLPTSLLYMATSGRHEQPYAPIRMVGDQVTIRVEFKDNGEIYLRNRKNPFTPMRNRFDCIEPADQGVDHVPNYVAWSQDEGQLIRFDEWFIEEQQSHTA